MDVERMGKLIGRAAMFGRKGEIKERLKGADKDCLNYENENGATPLIYAAREGHIDVAALLVDAGAELNMQTVDGGWTALMHAAYSGHLSTVQTLLTWGAHSYLLNDNKKPAADLAKTEEIRQAISSHVEPSEEEAASALAAAVTAANFEPTPVPAAAPELEPVAAAATPSSPEDSAVTELKNLMFGTGLTETSNTKEGGKPAQPSTTAGKRPATAPALSVDRTTSRILAAVSPKNTAGKKLTASTAGAGKSSSSGTNPGLKSTTTAKGGSVSQTKATTATTSTATAASGKPVERVIAKIQRATAPVTRPVTAPTSTKTTTNKTSTAKATTNRLPTSAAAPAPAPARTASTATATSVVAPKKNPSSRAPNPMILPVVLATEHERKQKQARAKLIKRCDAFLATVFATPSCRKHLVERQQQAVEQSDFTLASALGLLLVHHPVRDASAAPLGHEHEQEYTAIVADMESVCKELLAAESYAEAKVLSDRLVVLKDPHLLPW